MKARKKKRIKLAVIIITGVIVLCAGSAMKWDLSSMFEDTGKRKIKRMFGDVGIDRLSRVSTPAGLALSNLSGFGTRLSDFKGKIVFLSFWATWCSPCLSELPSIERLHNKLKDKNFTVVAINLKEPASEVKKFVKTHKLTFTNLLDPKGTAAVKFGVSSIPAAFILDKDGNVIGRANGARDWDTKKSAALFEYLIENPQE